MQQLDLDVATEFLLIAATLVELKARRLLPGRADVDLDEELALWEERDLLLARLLECKTFKDVSRQFGALADDADRSVARRVGPDERFAELVPDLLAGLTPERLREAAIAAFTPRPTPRIDLQHVAPIRASVADAVAELVDELPRTGRITFARLTAGAGRAAWRSSSASWPCSSCSSRAWSSSIRPTGSATSSSSGGRRPADLDPAAIAADVYEG